MRIVTALAALCVCAPAFAQTPAPATPAATPPAAAAAPKPAAPAPAAAAKPAPAKPEATGYAALPLADRIALQSDLVWTGDLNSIADGAWGDRSNTAIKTFQKRKGGKDSGTLTGEERTALAADAKAKQTEVGWRMVSDDNDIRLGIPAKLVPQKSKGKSGGLWQSARGEIQIEVLRQPAPATLTAIYDIERKNPGRKITYQVFKPDFFVISGTEGLKKFYMRAQSGKGEVRGVSVLYDQANEGMMEPMVVAISGAFTPFAATQVVAGAPPAKRRVEYSSGVVVSSAGDIVTDREAIDACQVIVIPGFGNADRVADDKTSGLALLRVYGVRDLKPLALGDIVKNEVTLVGIPDPQSQGGSAEVKTAKARVLASADSSTLEPAIALGFAGSAAIDADAGFVGIVVQKPQVVAGPATSGMSSTIAPMDAVRKLLAAQKVSASTGRASIEFAKDSVVRVICVRK
jgi:hypothetical protein